MCWYGKHPPGNMNPTISEGLIQRELERDPEGANAEWLAPFPNRSSGGIQSRGA